jgi:hypothetical protein
MPCHYADDPVSRPRVRPPPSGSAPTPMPLLSRAALQRRQGRVTPTATPGPEPRGPGTDRHGPGVGGVGGEQPLGRLLDSFVATIQPDAQHLPQGRQQAGDRHLKFHESRTPPWRDRLGLVPCQLACAMSPAERGFRCLPRRAFYREVTIRWVTNCVRRCSALPPR